MSNLLYNVEYWLARVAEARAIADQMQDPETKRVMLDIAKSYEELARHAARLRQAEKK